MASVTVINTTTTTASVRITGMNTGDPYKYKRFEFYIALPSDSSYTLVDTIGDSTTGLDCSSGEYIYTYQHLTQNTLYEYRIRILEKTPPNGVFVDEESNLDGTFTTQDSGGGGGGGDDEDPYYTFSYDSTSVQVVVHDISGYYFYYHCETDSGTTVFDSDDNGRTQNTSQLITGLSPNTTYRLRIGYSGTSAGNVTFIEHVDGGEWASFTTSSSQPSSDGGCYIYTGPTNGWVHATPYIYTGPTYGWVKATPYIYTGPTDGWVKSI